MYEYNLNLRTKKVIIDLNNLKETKENVEKLLENLNDAYDNSKEIEWLNRKKTMNIEEIECFIRKSLYDTRENDEYYQKVDVNVNYISLKDKVYFMVVSVAETVCY